MKIFTGCILVVFLFLAGCVGTRPLMAPRSREIIREGLWEIRLMRGKHELFSGLLVLGKEDGLLPYQLLDATGISLLTAKVDRNGNIEVISRLPLVGEKGLPRFIGKGLQRIMFDPGTRSYSVECEDHVMRKEKNWAGIALWKADYTVNARGVVTAVSLDLWWPQPDMYLHILEH